MVTLLLVDLDCFIKQLQISGCVIVLLELFNGKRISNEFSLYLVYETGV